jgi:rhodanese-related sulfurtransferase
MGNLYFVTNESKLKVAQNCAGEVEPSTAWEILSQDRESVLVDVRSSPELGLVGVANLSSLRKQPVFIPWKLFPNWEVNTKFSSQLEQEIGSDKNLAIFFLCKSGGRSLDAAIHMTEKGYTQCYNIIGGFEGDLDSDGHRGTINGWKKFNLPWEQR